MNGEPRALRKMALMNSAARNGESAIDGGEL